VDEVTEAQVIEKAIRDLHERVELDSGGEYCDVCSNHGDAHWPCATVAAVELAQEEWRSA
jgi:uncharacterized protein (UPF0212 family)